MRDVAVVGATMLKFGRYPDKDVVTLASEAAIGAIKDAGCSIKDVEIEQPRSEEHTSELQSRGHLVCRLLLEKKKLQDELLLLFLVALVVSCLEAVTNLPP